VLSCASDSNCVSMLRAKSRSSPVATEVCWVVLSASRTVGRHAAASVDQGWSAMLGVTLAAEPVAVLHVSAGERTAQCLHVTLHRVVLAWFGGVGATVCRQTVADKTYLVI
jgi:hypothetical protein